MDLGGIDMKYSFVIPCYNSENTITIVVDEIMQTMKQLGFESDIYEIILVNDYSKDNTKQIIMKLSNLYTCVKYISLSKNYGQEAACLAGYRHAAGEFIINMDDDGQTPPKEVGKLISKIDEGYDVVYAHYPNKHHSNFRNFGSRLNDLMSEKLIGKPKGIYLGTYNIMRRFVIEEIIKYENPYPYIRGLVLQITRNIVNVDVDHNDRLAGESNYTLKTLLKIWMNGFTAFSIVPLRISIVLGLLASLFSFILIIYAVVAKINNPTSELGWASTVSIISFFAGVILIVLGMIGEYLGRVYICINKTPQYVERESSYEQK